VKQAYNLYSACYVRDEDKSWAPHPCCITCYVNLIKQMTGEKNSMPLAIPVVWLMSNSRLEDSYFCSRTIEGHSKKRKDEIHYPSVKPAMKPVPDSTTVPPVPAPPSNREEFTIPQDNCRKDHLHSLIPATFPRVATATSDPIVLTK
jgi:hypothetical protein